MMKNVLKLILPVLIMGVVVACVATPVSAITLSDELRCDGCPADLPDVFKKITNTVLYVVGIIAVIMLIIGGIRYVVSGGDSKKVTDAKNTVLYAIIGLIITILSWAIVNFVIKTLPADTPEETASLTQIVS